MSDPPAPEPKAESSKNDDRLFHVPPHLVCRECQRAIVLDPALFDAHFRGEAVRCPACGHAHDWWSCIEHDIRTWAALDNAAVLAGAVRTAMTTTLKAGETKEVNLVAEGVPENAEIVALNMTSGGSARPLLAHSNRVPRELGPRFWIHGVNHSNRSEATDGPLYLSAIWFAPSEGDTVVRHLVDAAVHYAARRFEAQIVSANIAAEAALTPVVEKAIRKYGNADGRRTFFQDMKYSHVVHILLDVVADAARAARLAPEIRGHLNRLRDIRNAIMHTGARREKHALDENSAATYLAAAIFGVRYAEFLEAAVTVEPPSPDASGVRV